MPKNPQHIKPDPLHQSEAVLLDAANAVRGRNAEHGHTTRSFTMIAEMWSTYIKHAFTIRGNLELRADDVAEMQSIVKMVRSVYGESGDNYIDQAGYAALAAMLRDNPVNRPEPQKEPEATVPERLRMPKASPNDHPLLSSHNLNT